MEWRHQHKINTLLDDFIPPEVLAKYFSAGYTGVDKLKSSLLITRFGAMDLKGMLLSAKKRDYLMTVVEVVERGIRAAQNNPTKFKRSPDSIFQMTVIFDMAGFSMRHITFKPGIQSASNSNPKIYIML
jgi:metal transporter CNNM